jgi:hypothetical protein
VITIAEHPITGRRTPQLRDNVGSVTAGNGKWRGNAFHVGGVGAKLRSDRSPRKGTNAHPELHHFVSKEALYQDR